jgi:hypothetical protein
MVEYTGWDDYVKSKTTPGLDALKKIFDVGQAAFQTHLPKPTVFWEGPQDKKTVLPFPSSDMTPMDYRMYQDIEKRIKALEDSVEYLRRALENAVENIRCILKYYIFPSPTPTPPPNEPDFGRIDKTDWRGPQC